MPDPDDRRLEKPAYLGAPAPSTLTPRASRYLDSQWRRMGRESGRMVLLSLAGGVLFVFALMVLGHIVRG